MGDQLLQFTEAFGPFQTQVPQYNQLPLAADHSERELLLAVDLLQIDAVFNFSSQYPAPFRL